MSGVKCNFDTLMFCGIMEKLVDNTAAKSFINSVREGMQVCTVSYTIIRHNKILCV